MWYCIYDISVSLSNYINIIEKRTNIITPCFFRCFFCEHQKVTRSQEFPGLLWASSAATGACEAAARVRCGRNYRTLPRPETLIYGLSMAIPRNPVPAGCDWWGGYAKKVAKNCGFSCDSDTCPWCWLVFATYSTSQFLRGSKVGLKNLVSNPISCRSAVTQQIKALAIPGASGTIFFAAYVVPAISGSCFVILFMLLLLQEM